MTDIHKLHTELLEKHSREWVIGNNNTARWKDPSIPMWADLTEILRNEEINCLFYHAGCFCCAKIINWFSQQDQQTIEILERCIVELERELERELNEQRKNN